MWIYLLKYLCDLIEPEIPDPGDSNITAFGMKFCKKLGIQDPRYNAYFVSKISIFPFVGWNECYFPCIVSIQMLTWLRPIFILTAPILGKHWLGNAWCWSNGNRIWHEVASILNIFFVYMCLFACMYTYVSVLGMYVFIHMHNNTKNIGGAPPFCTVVYWFIIVAHKPWVEAPLSRFYIFHVSHVCYSLLKLTVYELYITWQ